MLFNWNVGTNTFRTVPCALDDLRIVPYLDFALGFWASSLDVKFSLLAGFLATILVYFSLVCEISSRVVLFQDSLLLT